MSNTLSSLHHKPHRFSLRIYALVLSVQYICMLQIPLIVANAQINYRRVTQRPCWYSKSGHTCSVVSRSIVYTGHSLSGYFYCWFKDASQSADTCVCTKLLGWTPDPLITLMYYVFSSPYGRQYAVPQLNT